MSEITAEQATGLLQVYLGTLKIESRTTASVLRAVPADRAEYRPDPVSKTALELVRHIANAEPWFIEAVLHGAFSPVPTVPESVTAPADIAAEYEARFATNFGALTMVSADQLTKLVDFRGRFQRPAVNFLLIGLHHTIHHRGQLSAYLRSMGAKVPAIYGESYDSAAGKTN